MIRVDRLWRHRGQLAAPAANARARWTAREALIVELVDGDGLRGQGEAAPLEGYSPDSLDQVERALGPLIGARLDETLPDGFPASARCALETARLDLAARARRQSLPQLLGVPPGTRVAVCASVDPGSLEQQLAQAGRAWSRGIRALKVKIGPRAAWSHELALLAELRRRFGKALSLRLDANGTIDAGELPAVAAELERFEIDLLEEPVSGGAWSQVEPVRVPLGADESLQRLDPAVVDAFRRGVLTVAIL
ncbi:MAG TPA: enolase C-terminal domain-like protein, partial [Solirubrobacteraceae bacterium]|nr:enolase C-terminal domain-like protein [Solirubrobacteraceae bacterium]